MYSKLNIIKNINYLSSCRIVPDWKWNSEDWNEFQGFFSDIPMCKDSFGNVYLNCKNTERLNSKLATDKILFLQAHLDHPGGRVIDNCDIGSNRYSVVLWKGGYGYKMEGLPVSVYSKSTKETFSSVIERDVQKLDERFLYIKGHSFKKGDIVHFPSSNCVFDSENQLIKGWALDDLVNCSVLLDFFSNKRVSSNVIGVLTLDEESGGQGASFFGRLVKKMDSPNKHTLINFEAPSENENDNLFSGNGTVIRRSDSRALFDVELTASLEKYLVRYSTRDIKSGGTEASLLSSEDFRVAGLAIPISYAHNGSFVGKWRSEEAAISDIDQMIKALDVINANSKEIINKGSLEKIRLNAEKGVDIVDESTSIVDSICKTKDYGEFLIKILPEWNSINQNYALPFVHLDNAQYQIVQKSLLEKDMQFWNSRDFSSLVKMANDKASDLIECERLKLIRVFLLFNPSFNAKKVKDGIGISLMCINEKDLNRILIHEITHLLTQKNLHINYLRSPVRAILSEGLACHISASALGLDPSRAINVQDKDYLNLSKNDLLLKSMFKDILRGRVVFERGKRHFVLDEKVIYSPFNISRENPFNKFGYYLGYHFVENCLSQGVSYRDICNDPFEILERLNRFLQ